MKSEEDITNIGDAAEGKTEVDSVINSEVSTAYNMNESAAPGKHLI